MNRNIASALEKFVEMHKVDQEIYLTALTDYIYARGAARLTVEVEMGLALAPVKSVSDLGLDGAPRSQPLEPSTAYNELQSIV